MFIMDLSSVYSIDRKYSCKFNRKCPMFMRVLGVKIGR